MTPKIPTIRRRKAWPKWGKFYAVDQSGKRYIFWMEPETCKDAISEGYWWNGLWLTDGGKTYQKVRGPRLSTDWAKTLRRIVPWPTSRLRRISIPAPKGKK